MSAFRLEFGKHRVCSKCDGAGCDPREKELAIKRTKYPRKQLEDKTIDEIVFILRIEKCFNCGGNGYVEK